MTSSTPGDAFFLEGLVERIFNTATVQGRLLMDTHAGATSRGTIPMSWFSKYCQEHMLVDNDADQVEALKEFCQKSKVPRVSKRRVSQFFKQLNESQNFNKSLIELEGNSDATDSDSGRGSRNSELKREEVVYDSDTQVVQLVEEGSWEGEFSLMSLPDSRSDCTIQPEDCPTTRRVSIARVLMEDEQLEATNSSQSKNLMMDISEAEITHLQTQLSLASTKITEQTHQILNLKTSLDDAYSKQEHILSTFHKSKQTDDSKICHLQQSLADEACSRESIVQELKYTKQTSTLANTNSSKKLVDYEQQLINTENENTVLKSQIKNYECTIIQLQNETILTRNLENDTQSPMSELKQALTRCRDKKCEISRLNKSDGDVSWWPDSSKPKPYALKTARRRSLDVGNGECLGEFVPFKQPSEEVYEVEITRVSYRKRFILSFCANVVLIGMLMYLGLLHFKDDLRKLGVLTITYHPAFYDQL